MTFRIDEGKGVATYEVGVEDDGTHSMLDYEKIQESVTLLEAMARSLNALVVEKVFYQNEHEADPRKRVVVSATSYSTSSGISSVEEPTLVEEEEDKKEDTSDDASDSQSLVKRPGVPTRCTMTIHRVETHLLDPSPSSLMDIASAAKASADMAEATGSPQASDKQPSVPSNSVSETLSKRNIRIAVVGNVDAGKSSLIGTLTTSCLDDGRGRSRISIMKHRHEIESGRTSTASSHLLGFRSTGEAIAGKDQVRANKTKSEDEIARESFRVVTLMDLAGHEKYLKTTIHGVSSGFADYGKLPGRMILVCHLPSFLRILHMADTISQCCPLLHFTYCTVPQQPLY